MGSVSPSHSPRLPSPPPFPEVQIGPQSPAAHAATGSSTQEHDDAARYDQSASRRIRPGTKAADMAAGPPMVPLSKVKTPHLTIASSCALTTNQLDSPFQLQEHLKALYANFTRPEKGRNTVPINAESAQVLAKAPDGVDQGLWLYELCRQLVIKENDVVVGFFSESPACSKDTCPEMRASEWQYLCAVHDPPKPCCAIDYCTHTLDWAAASLASPKNFPSRLTLGNQSTGGSQGGLRVITNIMRRCYRIFAHAWFQHRQVFWNIENIQGLYVFFKTVCDMYNLMPQDSYTIPTDLAGLASAEEESNDFDRSSAKNPDNDLSRGTETEATTTVSTGATTRRHKHTPSTGSAVTTIAEGFEDDDEGDHSPDKDVPIDMLSSSALKASSTSILAKGPAVEKGKTSDSGKQGIEDATSVIRGMDVMDAEVSSASTEAGEDSDAKNVIQDS
ncbi:MAG: hypothetical protein Q9166_006221 [cf. Caloplaca sp. 2 TL-2023]